MDPLPLQPLKDVSPGPYKVDQATSVDIGGTKINLTADAAATVFNKSDETDDDGIFATGDPPVISFATQRAWLKYSFSGTIAASPQFGTVIGVEIDASTQAAFLDYRNHQDSDVAASAAATDLSSPRTVLSLQSVQNLQPGEALSLSLQGKIGATVTLKWSDVLTTALPQIMALIPHTKPLGVTVDAGVTVTGSVKISDAFLLTISRTSDGLYRIELKKTKSNSAGFGVDVALDVTLDGDGTFQDIITNIGTELTKIGVPASEVSTVGDKVKAALKQKIGLSYTYEYAHTDEKTALIDFILEDNTRLQNDHAAAVAGNVGALAKDVNDNPAAYQLVTYLNQETITTTSSIGFSLSLGHRTLLSANEKSTIKTVERKNLANARMLSYLGEHAYTDNGHDFFDWTVDLKADMSAFVANPQTTDFDFGLQIDAVYNGAGRLDQVLDHAATWRVFADAAAAKAQASAFAFTKATVQILIDDKSVLGKILPLVDASDLDEVASALAAATPYVTSAPDRTQLASRQSVYAPIWKSWLVNGSTTDSPDNWRNLVAAAAPHDVAFEKSPLRQTFVDLVFNEYPDLKVLVAEFGKGAGKLADAINVASPAQLIDSAYDDLQAFWKQRMFVAAAGVWLLDAAETAGQLANVKRTLRLENGNQVLNITG